MPRNNYFSIFLFRMELSLRVVASSLAVCLFITTVANENIRFKNAHAFIIGWNVRNEKVWDITTAIDNEFIFRKLHAFATLSICSSGIEFSRTTRRWVLLLSSNNNHLVLRISINFSPLSSSKDPVQAWSRDHLDSGSKKSVWRVGQQCLLCQCDKSTVWRWEGYIVVTCHRVS